MLSSGPIQVVVLFGLGFTLLYALIITPINFGEEWGWRGYLLPQLLPLGQWPALLISGAIWGFWHAPIILLGFDYSLHPALGALLITVLGMIFGTLLGWTRLKTGSVWPAVLGHAGIDASAGAVLVFGRAGAPFDSAVLGLTGWTGWIVPPLIIALLVIARQLPVRNPPDAALQARIIKIESDPNAEKFYLHMGARRVGEKRAILDGQERVLPLLVLDVS